MSKATKRKHVTRQVLEEFVVPEGKQKIVRVLCGRGNNLHEVEGSSGEHFLVSMPTRFRRNVWIKRGDFVIVEPIAEGQRVQAEIVHILYDPQIKHLKGLKQWPVEFEEKPSFKEKRPPTGPLGTEPEASIQADKSDDEDDSDLFVNTNRPPPIDCDSPSSTSSSEEEN